MIRKVIQKNLALRNLAYVLTTPNRSTYLLDSLSSGKGFEGKRIWGGRIGVMSMFEGQVLTVGQLSLIVGETLALIPAGLVVEGEVQKVRIYKDFMVFFELSGEGQSINCFSTLKELGGEVPQENSQLQVVGEVQTGKKTELRFRVRKIRSSGEIGSSAKKLEEVKLRLRAEGAFDDSRKKPLPRFPKKVAVITSGSSSAWEDFKRVSSSRFLASELVLFNSSVQGNSAVQEICSKLDEIATKASSYDVIAIVRGGGAKGDLEAFNSEDIARKVLEMTVPVVSGVGHEDDISLLDLVADVRASTPSNAAEIIFPDSKDLLKEIERLGQRSTLAISRRISLEEECLTSLRSSVIRALEDSFSRLGSKLDVLKARLEGLDFEKLFSKGFALLETKKGDKLTSVKGVKGGDSLQATLRDGKLELEVK